MRSPIISCLSVGMSHDNIDIILAEVWVHGHCSPVLPIYIFRNWDYHDCSCVGDDTDKQVSCDLNAEDSDTP